jgi:hypothetical protein
VNAETYKTLAQRFPYIVMWEQRMGSFQYYRDAQLLRAAKENAPSNAIYFQNGVVEHPVGVFKPRGWQTTDDISNPEIVLDWQLSCVECGGKRARIKGCTNSRHDLYDMANFV